MGEKELKGLLHDGLKAYVGGGLGEIAQSAGMDERKGMQDGAGSDQAA